MRSFKFWAAYFVLLLGSHYLINKHPFTLAVINCSPHRVWTYLLDFGSESLKVFKDAPHVGDVIFLNESEKIGRFFEMISKEIKDRKTVLSN